MTEPAAARLEEPRFILAGGLRFAYLESGSGPLVLLLHGFPDDAYSFDNIRPTLAAAGYHAVAPFQRGYYPTDIPADGDYEPLTIGRDVLALIAAFGEAEAVVVGQDWGAIAGYLAASLAPERVRKLVAMGIPHAAAIKPTPRQIWRARHFIYLTMPWAARMVRRRNLAHVDTLYHRWSPEAPPDTTELTRVKAELARPGRLEASFDYYHDVLATLLRRSSRRVLLRPIRVPTMGIAGTEDHAVAMGTMAVSAKHCRAGYRLHPVEGAGHFVHRERPAEVAAVLLDFLRSTP